MNRELVHIGKNRGSVPKYRKIGQHILDEIRSGKIKPGDKLMGEFELADHFQVSRVTIRNAMVMLRDAGAIDRSRGSGTFVTEAVERSAVQPAQDVQQVMFLFIDMPSSKVKSNYNLGELMAAERYLAQRDIGVSWATLSTENIIHNSYPPLLEKGLCQGILLDGRVRDSHFALGDRFGVPALAVGNHKISPDRPQVRVDIAHSLREGMLELRKRHNQPIALLIEPPSIDLTQDILSAYSKTLPEIGQSDDLVYMCPQDNAHGAIKNLVRDTDGSRFSVVTTDTIVADISRTYDETGLSFESNPVLALGWEDDLAPEDKDKVYFLGWNFSTYVLRSVECLTEMMENQRSEVYEALPLSFRSPRTPNRQGLA